MIDKTKGSYEKTLLSWQTIELLDKFSQMTGYSKSYILKTLIEINLPVEVEKYCNKMEVINETSTKIQKS